MAKRPRPDETVFVFDLANCIGSCDDDGPVAEVGAVAGFCEAMEIQTAFSPFPTQRPLPCPEVGLGAVDDEPLLQDLGITYSPADDERGCHTPDPTEMLDANSTALLDLLGCGSSDADRDCDRDRDAQFASMETLPPLAAQPMAGASLNQSGHQGCFATHPVADPPVLATAQPSFAQRNKLASFPERKSDVPFEPHSFKSIPNNHSGVFSEFGGVRAWLKAHS